MQMRFDLDGQEGEPFLVPDGDLVAHLAPRPGPQTDLGSLVEAALDDPLDAPRLEAAARRAARILLLVDDASRETPLARMLPPFVARLEAAGVADDQVTVLVAQGTHRPMTQDELEEKLGPFVGRWKIHQHDNRDLDQLVRLGATADGMPVVVNRLIPEHDLVIGFGTVAVHGIMGYSGGAKIAMIGACGPETEVWTHWQAATRYATHELMGHADNALRRNLEEGARMCGLDAVVNIVNDGRGNPQQVAYGDPVAVHRALVPTVQRLFTAEAPARADVVVVDARPADRDYWQSVKGLYAADLVAKEGGAVVLVAKNPEGVADNHPNLLELSSAPYPEIVHQVEAGHVADVIGAAVAAYTARFRRRAHVYLVSSGIRSDEARALGFTQVRTVQEALDRARSAVGASPKIMVLDHGGSLLPRVATAPATQARPTTAPHQTGQAGR